MALVGTLSHTRCNTRWGINHCFKVQDIMSGGKAAQIFIQHDPPKYRLAPLHRAHVTQTLEALEQTISKCDQCLALAGGNADAFSNFHFHL